MQYVAIVSRGAQTFYCEEEEEDKINAFHCPKSMWERQICMTVTAKRTTAEQSLTMRDQGPRRPELQKVDNKDLAE